MNKRVLYLFLLTGVLLLVSCAGKKQYEWIKIKSPDVSNEYSVRKAGPRKVNVLVRLTEKINSQYVEDSGEFFNKYPVSDSGKPLTTHNRQKTTKNKVEKRKGIASGGKDNSEDVIHQNEAFSASKLNNSMIFPDKLDKTGETHKADKESKIDREDKIDEAGETDKSERENPLLNYNDIEDKKNLSVKDLFPEFSDVLAEDESPDKKGEFIWAGLILVILGIISGLIFGRYTYLISVGGLLLIAIGYYLGM